MKPSLRARTQTAEDLTREAGKTIVRLQGELDQLRLSYNHVLTLLVTAARVRQDQTVFESINGVLHRRNALTVPAAMLKEPTLGWSLRTSEPDTHGQIEIRAIKELGAKKG